MLTISRPTGIDGGDGNDLVIVAKVDFTVDWQRKAQFDMVGGAGQDTTEIGSAVVALYAPGTKTGLTDYDVLGFETILFTGGTLKIIDYQGLGGSPIFGAYSESVECHVDGQTYQMGVGNDGGTVVANDVTFFGGEGSDAFTVRMGRRALIYGGDGTDSLTLKWGARGYGGAGSDTILAAGDSTAYGGFGNDSFFDNGVGATLFGDFGDDRFDLSFDSWEPGESLHVVYGGAGTDNVTVHRTTAQIDLGTGGDKITLTDQINASQVPNVADVILSTGSGADVVYFNDTDGTGTVTIVDFDVARDRMSMGFAHLSDFDAVSSNAQGVTLTEQGYAFVLLGVSQVELTDAILLFN